MTIVIIAHRLSTVRNADQVFALNKGNIIQKSEFMELPHDEKGMFSHFLNKQFKAVR